MRVWALVCAVGLLIAAILGVVATATVVVSDQGLDYTYTEMQAPQFFSGAVAYENLDDEGSTQLQAGLGFLMTGILATGIAGLLTLVPAFVSRIPNLAATILVGLGLVGAIFLIVAPMTIAAGASAMTDGAVDGSDGAAGYWLPISGMIVAGISCLAGGLVGLGSRFGSAEPESA